MVHPTPNLTWFAIFSDRPETVVEVEVEEGGDLLARFDMVGHLGHHNRRKLKGMWIIRRAGDSDYVLRIHGSVPAEISARFYADRRHGGR